MGERPVGRMPEAGGRVTGKGFEDSRIGGFKGSGMVFLRFT